jgi:hypothetical protein
VDRIKSIRHFAVTEGKMSNHEIEKVIEEKINEAKTPGRERWDWVKFIKGWINQKFLAFILTTLMVYKLLFEDILSLDTRERLAVIIVWGVVTVFFILGRSIDNAFYNAKISGEFKAGVQANINTDTAKVIEAVKNIKG